jgi:hypothetical protein
MGMGGSGTMGAHAATEANNRRRYENLIIIA